MPHRCACAPSRSRQLAELAAALWLSLVALALGACGQDGASPPPLDPASPPAMIASAGGAGGGGGTSAQPQPATAGAGSGAQAGSTATPDASQPAAGSMPPNATADAGAAGTAGSSGQPPAETVATLFWLDILGNRVLRANADGGELDTIASGNGISAPDGVAVDVESGFVYWTNMGSGLGGAELGTLQRMPFDGGSVETVVPVGVTNTPKQMTIDRVNRKLYWSDREGAKVWRANMDGSQPEILASGHGFGQLVGIAVDVEREHFYFTDRNERKILRAGFALPAGQSHDDRTDIEELIVFAAGAMPIDLDLDLEHRLVYWTDRARGTLQRAAMDIPAGQSADGRTDIEVLASDLGDAIGISLDVGSDALYFTALSGQVWRARLDGSNQEPIASSGSATGIALVHLPKP